MHLELGLQVHYALGQELTVLVGMIGVVGLGLSKVNDLPQRPARFLAQGIEILECSLLRVRV